MRYILCTAAVVVVMAAIGCGSTSALHSSSSAISAISPPAERIVGVFEPDDPGSYGQLAAFSRAAGVAPGVVVYYSNWGMPFASAFAAEAAAHGARTLVQMDPRNVSLAAIAAGQQDGYLRSYAGQVRSFRRKVIISFGQEMNGTWYPWGSGHVAPAVFVAAWRHVVRLFRSAGATNVRWLWDVNCNLNGQYPVAPWWPGASYVDWAGIDCYYAHHADTFAGLFVATITEVRRLTRGPVMIGETAMTPTADEPARISALFAGVRKYGLSGLVWFDQAQSGGLYHQDWRLEGHVAALAAFRRAARAYLRGTA